MKKLTISIYKGINRWYKLNKIYNDQECEIIRINEIKNKLNRTFELCTDYYNLIKDEANKFIKTCLKENEKFDGFEIVKANRYNQGKEVINSRSWKIFGLGFIPIPFLNQYFMKSQLNEMVKDLVSIYRDCKKEIFEDNLVGVVVSKAFGGVASVGGGIAGFAAIGALGAARTQQKQQEQLQLQWQGLQGLYQ